jgi:hypothetical protein
MSQQRMAGDNQFQSEMKKAAKGPGGQEHKTKPASLIGANAWDTQVQRESQQFNNAAVSGSRGAENIAAYANVSKSATQANGNFSQNTGNKWVDNARSQGNTSRQQNAGFSDSRVNNNVEYTNQQQDRNLSKNEGFAMRTTNNFVNNAKNHREDNTAKATDFANRTVDKYIAKNKATNSTNVTALDHNVRKAPIIDKAYSDVQGLNTYGDMYSYGRKDLPQWAMPTPMGPSDKADIEGITNDARKDIKDTKL